MEIKYSDIQLLEMDIPRINSLIGRKVRIKLFGKDDEIEDVISNIGISPLASDDGKHLPTILVISDNHSVRIDRVEYLYVIDCRV